MSKQSNMVGSKKFCSICGEVKPLIEFYKRTYKSGKVGKSSNCKTCTAKSRDKWQEENPVQHRKRNAARILKCRIKTFNTSSWKRQGIKFTKKKYVQRFSEQGETCAICKEPQSLYTKKRYPIDHNHETGQVRGVVCHRCNLIIALVENEPQIVKAAQRYLRAWNVKGGVA